MKLARPSRRPKSIPPRLEPPAHLYRSLFKMPATLKEFESVFPKLVEDLKQECIKYKLPEQALTWFEKVRPTCEGRDERMNE